MLTYIQKAHGAVFKLKAGGFFLVLQIQVLFHNIIHIILLWCHLTKRKRVFKKHEQF